MSLCGASDQRQLPTLTYPSDWEDEERMHFLLGPFSPTAVARLSLNDQKAQFWSSLVRHACRQFRQPVFSGRQMAQRLQWRGQAPSCLLHVLRLMQQTGQLRELGREDGREGGWLSWARDILSSPIKWAWHSPSDAVADQRYIDIQLLTELADSVLHQLQSGIEFKSTDQLVTAAQLRAVSARLVEASSVVAVENELLRQGKLSRRTASNGLQVVKFIAAGESGPVFVSEIDHGILSLKECITTLQKHLVSLQNRVQMLKGKAQDHLRLKQREPALCCVRRSREVRQLLATKAAMLENLQQILHQIQMAETNVMVMDAYHKGTEALKAMQRSSGLSVASAEKIMEELYEAVQVSDAVGSVLGEGVMGDNNMEDEELEGELQALMSTVESSHEGEPASLAEQLSQLHLIRPPDTAPADANTVSEGQQTERTTTYHHAPLTTPLT